MDPDSALTIEDVEAHFGELAEQAESSRGPGVGNSLASNTVVGGNDPSFASAFMNPSSQGIEHLSLGVINQPGGSALLSSTLGVVSFVFFVSDNLFSCFQLVRMGTLIAVM